MYLNNRNNHFRNGYFDAKVQLFSDSETFLLCFFSRLTRRVFNLLLVLLRRSFLLIANRVLNLLLVLLRRSFLLIANLLIIKIYSVGVFFENYQIPHPNY